MYFYFNKSEYYISSKKYPYISDEQIRSHNQSAKELESLIQKYSQLDAENQRIIGVSSAAVGLLLAALAFFIILGATNSHYFAFLSAICTLCWGSAAAYYVAEFILGSGPELKLQESIIREKTQYLNNQLLAFEELKKKHAQYWLSMNGWQFEKEVAKLYEAHGYRTVVTKGSDDGGIDIFLTKNDTRIGVQCKNYHKPVTPAVIRELAGAMMHENLDGGIVIASSGYTKRAKEFAENKPITLLDINDVLQMHGNSLVNKGEY